MLVYTVPFRPAKFPPSCSRSKGNPLRAPTGESGFSLVEVVLALTIVAFAFVGLMGLLPTGLGNFRSAVDRTMSGQIFQRVLTDAEQADFDTVLAQGASKGGEFFEFPIRYFDEQGVEVVPASPGNLSAAEAARVIYHVHIRGSVPGVANVSAHNNARFTSLPASPEHTRFNPRTSSFLTIQIASNPQNRNLAVNDRALWDPADAPMTNYTAIIARNGSPKKTK